jgi:hypothetical protein
MTMKPKTNKPRTNYRIYEVIMLLSYTINYRCIFKMFINVHGVPVSSLFTS